MCLLTKGIYLTQRSIPMLKEIQKVGYFQNKLQLDQNFLPISNMLILRFQKFGYFFYGLISPKNISLIKKIVNLDLFQ